MYSDRSGETVTVMLNTGTNVNVCDNKNKSTPLHLAVNQGNDGGVKALLASRHCDVNCQVLDVKMCLYVDFLFLVNPSLLTKIALLPLLHLWQGRVNTKQLIK